MKNFERIQVKGEAAQKLKQIANAKAAKLKAIREKPIQDLSKLKPIG